MSASEVDRTIVRLAYQIVEENGVDGLGLIGVRRRGVPLAERLSKSIGHIEDDSRSRRHVRYHVLSRRSFHGRTEAGRA